MFKIIDYYSALNDYAPFNIAESWDNVGLIVGDMQDNADRVMLALDVTQKVLDEAVENKAKLIITHHPLMFNAIKKLSSKSLVYQLAKHQIGLIAAHTNLDATKGGINDVIAQKLGLKQIKGLSKVSENTAYNLCVYVPEQNAEELYNAIIETGAGSFGGYCGCAFLNKGEGRFMPMQGANPAIGRVGESTKVKEIKMEFLVNNINQLDSAIKTIRAAHPYEQPAYSINTNYAVKDTVSIGLVGELETALTATDFANIIKKIFGSPSVQFTDFGGMIKKVAVCSGGGSGLINDVIKSNADAYLTGELKYDTLLEATNHSIMTFQAGHFYTENIVMPKLKRELENRLAGADIFVSSASSDEIKVI